MARTKTVFGRSAKLPKPHPMRIAIVIDSDTESDSENETDRTIALDIAVAQTLSDQIKANRASITSAQHQHAVEPTPFRIVHSRLPVTIHPLQSCQPYFFNQHGTSFASAMVLFTHLLSYALPIYHTLIHRTPMLRPRESMSDPRVWEYPEPHQVLTSSQRAHTWEFMRRIGDQVDWFILEMEGEQGGTDGICDLQPSRSLEESGMFGCASTITTSRHLVRTVEEAFRSGDLAKQQSSSLRLAIIWLHEMSHAVEHAVLPNQGRNYVLLGPKARTSELVFEVEGRVLGGQFWTMAEGYGPRESLVGEMALTDWPDWQTMLNYRKSEMTNGSEEETNRACAVMWQVDANFVKHFFDESFWRKDSTIAGGRALWPEKNIGVLVTFVERELTESEMKKFEDKMDSEGYKAKGWDLISKK